MCPLVLCRAAGRRRRREAGALQGWQHPVLALAGSACETAARAFCPAGEQLPPGFTFPSWQTRMFAKRAALPHGG